MRKTLKILTLLFLFVSGLAAQDLSKLIDPTIFYEQSIGIRNYGNQTLSMPYIRKYGIENRGLVGGYGSSQSYVKGKNSDGVFYKSILEGSIFAGYNNRVTKKLYISALLGLSNINLFRYEEKYYLYQSDDKDNYNKLKWNFDIRVKYNFSKNQSFVFGINYNKPTVSNSTFYLGVNTNLYNKSNTKSSCQLDSVLFSKPNRTNRKLSLFIGTSNQFYESQSVFYYVRNDVTFNSKESYLGLATTTYDDENRLIKMVNCGLVSNTHNILTLSYAKRSEQYKSKNYNTYVLYNNRLLNSNDNFTKLSYYYNLFSAIKILSQFSIFPSIGTNLLWHSKKLNYSNWISSYDHFDLNPKDNKSAKINYKSNLLMFQPDFGIGFRFKQIYARFSYRYFTYEYAWFSADRELLFFNNSEANPYYLRTEKQTSIKGNGKPPSRFILSQYDKPFSLTLGFAL